MRRVAERAATHDAVGAVGAAGGFYFGYVPTQDSMRQGPMSR